MGSRILVVEDNPDLHLGLALRLKSVGHTVLSAMTADEAIPVALRERPNLILLDIGLPGRSGHLVAKELAANESTRSIPIIYLTARHELKHRLQAAVQRRQAVHHDRIRGQPRGDSGRQLMPRAR
jgi:DNA-binding response OmpR family regulator